MKWIKCQQCDGDGQVEILGDGAHFECDVIGYKPCNECEGSGEVLVADEDDYE